MEMKSMTAYSHVVKKSGAQSVQVVMRSNNFKYLNVMVHNLPMEYIELEDKIKKDIETAINRGKIEAHIFLKHQVAGEVHVNEEVFSKYVNQARKLAKKYGLKDELSIRDFLSLPQVIWLDEKNSDAAELVVAAARQAIRELLAFKIKEGAIIKNEMLKNLKKLQANAAQMEKEKPSPAAEENNKEDIDEEISLLTFYAKKLEKEISSKQDSKGKAIDFLTQEILRELNAASSKTKKPMLASLIVESKSYLERIREQAQNIE
jgi:uncharacterized protein YicC (UPF0701 family)